MKKRQETTQNDGQCTPECTPKRSFAFSREKLEALQAEAKRVVYHDSQVPGLVLRVNPTGSKSFYLYRRIHGKVKHIRLGPFPGLAIQNARGRASRYNAEIAEGRFLDATSLRMKWSELHQLYIEDAKTRISSWHDAELLNSAHLSDWQGLPLKSITFEAVTARHMKLGQTSPTVANRLLSMISSTWKHGVRSGLIDRRFENPAKGVAKFPEKARKRFLSPEELVRFLDAVETIEGPFRDFFLLLLVTGQRSGKVRSMEWDDINFDQSLWRIAKNKNGESITIHLPDPAIEILKRRDRSGQFVFPSSAKSGYLRSPWKTWAKVCKQANLTDFRIHDLRHTMASYQAMNGGNLTVIGQSLGHRSTASTARYAHVSMDSVRESVDSAVATMMGVRGSQSDPEATLSGKSPVERLKALKELLEADLISIDEFNAKKAEILDQL